MRRTRAIALALAIMTMSCANTARSTSPLPVEAQRLQIEEWARRVQLQRAVLRAHLVRSCDIARELSQTPPTRYAPPFPLAMFKHTAMACLNAPPARRGAAPEAPLEPGALRCAPETLPALRAALDRLAIDPAPAMHQLALLDEARHQRELLRLRALRVTTIETSSRQLIAQQRARLLKLNVTLKRQRGAYDSDAWEQSQASLTALLSRLDQIDRELDALVREAPGWPEREQDVFAHLIFLVAGLSGAGLPDASTPPSCDAPLAPAQAPPDTARTP